MPFDVYAYDAHRPSYPAAVLDALADLGALARSNVVADVGSGTGIFSELLIHYGCRVLGVEPSSELSALADVRLAGRLRFTNVLGSAEATSLDDHCVDLVTVASALHWFDADASRTEFRRILREPGWTAVLWNFRTQGDSAFGAAFDELWHEKLGPPPAAGRDEIEDAVVPEFFDGATHEAHSFPNPLPCNEERLIGLAASSSNAPPRASAGWRGIEQQLRRLFRLHQIGGLVQVPYETVMYCGRLL